MSYEAGRGVVNVIKELLSYKSAVLGIAILTFLVALSIYTVITIPYERAIFLWRGGERYWMDTPRNAMPIWFKALFGKNYPETIIVDSRKAPNPNVVKAVTPIPGTNIKKSYIELSFYYDYDDFPSEVNVFFFAKFNESFPIVKIYWEKPDGEKILLKELEVKAPDDIFFLTIDEGVLKTLRLAVFAKGGNISGYVPSRVLLFVVNDGSIISMKTAKLLKSSFFKPPRKYRLIIDAVVFGKDSDLDAKLVVYGTVYGLAGTDHLRRDIMIAILWGTPIALAFGLTCSLTVSIVHLIIAVASGWYGGKVDFVIQRLTEIYMIIPFLPFLILINMFYKITIWVLILVILVLSIFGGGIKSTRALVMQIKEEPYIEAALAYGASSRRIIFFYIIPKILPPIIPGLISSVPGFVFLEAGLSFLGLGDPYLPTWGKVINDAYTNGALYKGLWWWVLIPSFMLILTAISFALIGFALDKIVNPKLRER